MKTILTGGDTTSLFGDVHTVLPDTSPQISLEWRPEIHLNTKVKVKGKIAVIISGRWEAYYYNHCEYKKRFSFLPRQKMFCDLKSNLIHIHNCVRGYKRHMPHLKKEEDRNKEYTTSGVPLKLFL